MSKDEEETVYLFLKKEWQRCTNNCKIWCRWNGLKNVRLMVPEPLTLHRPLWDPLSRPVPSPALATGYPRYHEASNVFFKLVISWSRDWKFCQSGSPHRIQRNDLTFKKWKEQEKKSKTFWNRFIFAAFGMDYSRVDGVGDLLSAKNRDVPVIIHLLHLPILCFSTSLGTDEMGRSVSPINNVCKWLATNVFCSCTFCPVIVLTEGSLGRLLNMHFILTFLNFRDVQKWVFSWLVLYVEPWVIQVFGTIK